MKKILLSLILIAPMLAGCTNINTDITINDNKSAEVVTELTYDGNINNPQDSAAKTILDSSKNFLDNSYISDIKVEDNTSILKASKKTANLSIKDLDLSSLGFVSNLESNKFIEIKKNFLISSYNIDMTYDYNKVAQRMVKPATVETTTDSDTMQPEYYQKYADLSETEIPNREDDNLDDEVSTVNNNEQKNDETVTAALNIKVPSFASYNNADSSNGNIYTWNIKKDTPTVIKLQYVRYSGFAIGLVLILGAGLLIIITRRILKHETQKRMDNVENIV